MKKAFGFGIVFAVAFFLQIPGEAFAQKGKKTGDPASPEEYKSLFRLKDLSGTVVSADKGTIIVRVDVPAPPGTAPAKGNNAQQNPQNKTAQAQAKLQQDMAKLNMEKQMIARNPKTAGQKMMQIRQKEMKLQQDYQKLMATMNGTNVQGAGAIAAPVGNFIKKDFELELADNVVIRKMFLGTEYDDMGNLKVYKEEEKAKLRGSDPTKPGYQSKVEDIGPGQTVTVTFVKSAAPVAAPVKKVAPKKEDDEAPALTPPSKPTVSLVLLKAESTGAPAGNPVNPKKKK